jgi:hypothetical protein
MRRDIETSQLCKIDTFLNNITDANYKIALLQYTGPSRNCNVAHCKQASSLDPVALCSEQGNVA